MDASRPADLRVGFSGALGRFAIGGLAALVFAVAGAFTASAQSSAACTSDGRVLNYGFFAHYNPVSYSADGKAGSSGFNTHQGYEADLLTALEAMKGAGLSFSRRGVGPWDNIWLLPAGSDFDMVGGGITILETRTRNDAGQKVVAFTDGHIKFRQSLLVRAKDAKRLDRYGDLDDDVRVGVFPGTSGESRLLELTGMADSAGVLAAGVRIETPNGEVTADGSGRFVITAGGTSPSLTKRQALRPPSDDMPHVVYFDEGTSSAEQSQALLSDRVDAVAGDEIGNLSIRAEASGLAVTALDSQVESGGFSLAAGDAKLIACINRKIDWLTDGGKLGTAAWFDDREVFMKRAKAWSPDKEG